MNAQSFALVALLQPFVGKSGTVHDGKGGVFSGTLTVLDTFRGEAVLVRSTDRRRLILQLGDATKADVLENRVEVAWGRVADATGILKPETEAVLRFER